MFRITPYVLSARSVLYRRHPSEVHFAAISQSTHNFKYKDPCERETCKIPPPPPPPARRDDSLLWGALALLFMTGGFAVYARTQPEIRDWLTINAPWFDDLIAIAYQENMTYKEFISNCVEDLKRYVADDTKPRQCSIDGAPVPAEIVETPKEVVKDAAKPDETASKTPPPIPAKNICEVEASMKDVGEFAYINYMTARDACICYNKLVEETMQNFSVSGVRSLREAMAERVALVKEHVNKAITATTQLDELIRYLECGVKAPKESMDNMRVLIKELQNKIKTMLILYTWENDKSLAVDAQWQKVEVMVDNYTEQNQTMFSGINYEGGNVQMQGDADLLLYHTMRYVELLRAELSEAVSGMTVRVNRAVDTLPQGLKEKMAREYEIQATYKKKKADLDREFKKRYDDQKAANEKILRDSLKKQLDRSQEILANRLDQKEKEATTKLNQLVEERVATEKKLMKRQVREMSTKVQMIEDKLGARLKAERETRRSQELWTAGASLLAATKKGEPYVKVDKELKAIEKASGGDDKLVMTVLKAIPESVKQHGLVPESVLREKYHVMEKTALKVALVEQEGAPLPVYFMSWLQSMLLFMKISGIPQEEIDKPPKEPSKELDTFDLLQRARFWMEHGNIGNALRYVSSLEGASRGAAVVWSEAARSHLETRQAAEAVLAHAAALGLQYI